MAQRRSLLTLTRRAVSFVSTRLYTPPSLSNPIPSKSYLHLTPKYPLVDPTSHFTRWSHRNSHHHRHFSSTSRSDAENKAEAEEEEIGEEEEEEHVTGSGSKEEYTPEEKEAEAAAIGYKVVGPLEPSDRIFKAYEPVFAVVQIGSHQFKVSNGDCIFTERLKFCEVNDKLILDNVLLLGSSTQTIVGRPTIPDAAVHAVVEEHALDAKVIIFKKRRRKNYRRTKGHRQELTQLRITDIQGIDRPEKIVHSKPKMTAVKNEENVAVAA